MTEDTMSTAEQQGNTPFVPHVVPGDTVDEIHMRTALALAAEARTRTAPNPWVGCVLVWQDGRSVHGATQPPGGRHAEAQALHEAAKLGWDPEGTSAYVTLEPCSHHGRTPPCAEALVAAGVRRVVVGLVDPDAVVAGRGLARLGEAGVAVHVGVLAAEIEEQLAPYLHHRRSGRPYVVLKLASTMDGATAMADGSSQWITCEAARADAHRLRAESQAIMVGAGTVRADDPSLTVRLVEGPDPLRVVMGHAPFGARVHPCLERQGDIGPVLDELGAKGVLQLMVEGGASLAHDLHAAGLIDRYVIYLAPAMAGGNDHTGLLEGPGAASMAQLWRGRIVQVRTIGCDLRVDLVPNGVGAARAPRTCTTRGATIPVRSTHPQED